MWLTLLTLLPAILPAQNEATLGKWERLYFDNEVVTWRRNDTLFSWDQQFQSPPYPPYDPATAVAPDKAWQSVYGIHAALLPVSGETGALRRGWVILWGGGKERRGDNFLVHAPEAERHYFVALVNRYVPKTGITPVLLWHHEEGSTQSALYGYVRYLFDSAPLWNNSEQAVYPPYNLFCSGHALLSDGRLFVVGGHGGLYNDAQGANNVGYIGLRLLSIFQAQNFQRGRTEREQNLWWTFFPPPPRDRDEAPEPRWYPSVVALPDGKMLIVGGTRYGFWNVGAERTKYHEIFDPCTGQVVRSENQVHQPHLGENYPRLHLVSFMQGGQLQARVVYTGPRVETYFLANPSNPSSQWQPYEINGQPIRRAVGRSSGTSVLLPNPVENPKSLSQQVLSRVLTIGGSGDTTSLSYEINDFSSGNLAISPRQSPPNNPSPRVDFNAVLLPTGQVLVIGGREPGDGWVYPDNVVFRTLLYNQSDNSWQEVAPAPSEDADNNGIKDGTRVYHSTALLLPDGRVLTAGSATSDSAGRSVTNYVPTLYSPPYLFKPDGTRRGETDRPRILNLSHTELNYGQNFEITYALADDSNSIRSVVLVRPGSVTHSFNFEQRLVRLRFLETVPSSGELVVTAPWAREIAPPGWYLLFLVDENGVPSKASWIRLKAPDCTMATAEPATLMVELEGAQTTSAEQADAIEHSPLTLEFRHPATDAIIATYTLPMGRPDEQGRVRLALWSDLPAGTYVLYVRPYRSWLGWRVLVQWRSGGVYAVLLRNGDVVKDNAVDVADLVAVLEQLGETGVCEADVTCDGVVDGEDAALVATNVGLEGDE